MSHPLCYTIRRKIKIMKDKNEKANNLILGAIYINNNTGQPCRLVHIVSCQGVYHETYDGQGYGDLVKFDDVSYADIDEVNDYLEDLRVYEASNKAPSHKVMTPFGMMENHSVSTLPDEIHFAGIVAQDDEYVVGYYNDDDGNDIRCRD